MIRLLAPVAVALLALVVAGLLVHRQRAWRPPATPTAPPPTPAPAWPLERGAAPAVDDDQDQASLERALGLSLRYMETRPAGTTLRFGPDEVPATRVAATLKKVAEALGRLGLGEAFHRWAGENLEFYRSTADPVLFTGYHLAYLRGARQKGPRFRFPIYRRPKDMVRIELSQFSIFQDFPGLPRHINARVDDARRVVPYLTREQIDFEDRLGGLDLEIVWVDSLVDLHSLHVQGSGVVELEGGEKILVGFADSNGHRFRGVGEVLLTEGRIPRGKVSYQDVRDFLKANPQLHREVMSKNARYVFFRQLEGGAVGSLGLEVTPHRSIATDHAEFPPGALALIETDRPVFDEAGARVGWKRFRRLVLAQDTGAAIRGPAHVDLYCGFGPANERIAGSMHQAGRLWFLLAKPAPEGPG